MTHLFRNKTDTLVEWVLSQVPDRCEDRVLWARGFLTGLHKAGCIGPNTYREAVAAVSEEPIERAPAPAGGEVF